MPPVSRFGPTISVALTRDQMRTAEVVAASISGCGVNLSEQDAISASLESFRFGSITVADD